jgi:hypothetical protein
MATHTDAIELGAMPAAPLAALMMTTDWGG